MDGWLRIGTKIDNKETDKQLALLKHKLNETQKEIEVLNKTMAVGGFSEKAKNDLVQMEANAEKLKNQINQIEFPETNKTQNLAKGFEKLYSSAKKFALGIISIRTAYTILSKASSSYLATDEKTTNQLEANWVGLGTILEPAITFITNLMKKAVTSVLYFLSAFTGTDYIAKANANALKKQAQATKELTKANNQYTASFDEMNIVNSDTSSVNASDDSTLSSLFDINDISEGTRKSIEKIAEAIKPVYEIIKDIIGWALDNPQAIIGILGGTALLTTLAKIIGVAGVGGMGTGLAGIYGLLLAIASIGVITVTIKTIRDNAESLGEGLENNLTQAEGGYKNAQDYAKTVNEISKDEEKWAKNQKNIIKGLKELTKGEQDHIEGIKEEISSWGVLERAYNTFSGVVDVKGRQVAYATSSMFEYIDTFRKLYKERKLDDEATKEYIETLKIFASNTDFATMSIFELSKQYGVNEGEANLLSQQYHIVANELKRLYENGDITAETLNSLPENVRVYIKSNAKETKETIDELPEKINEIPSKKEVVLKVDAETQEAKNKISSLVNRITGNFTNLFGSLGLKINFPKLAVGGIVNNPGKGVYVGGAITGEAGREGVLPLTDSRTMQELGYEIGKWITVNATMNNYMNGRLMQRQICQMDKDKEFATNGRR